MSVKYLNGKKILNVYNNLMVQLLHFKTKKYHEEIKTYHQFLWGKMWGIIKPVWNNILEKYHKNTSNLLSNGSLE
jgi:hypothetical protein